MTRAEIIKAAGKEAMKQRQQEQETLQGIAAVTTPEFAKQAAGVLNPKKHWYGFEAYLILLDNLKALLYAGMPDSLALESVQCGYGVETILAMWRLLKV